MQSHYNGMRTGIEMYAWWKDGTQYVGTVGRTLKEALEETQSREAEAIYALKEKYDRRQNG